MNRLTAKLVDRLPAKLVVVSLLKLHLTKLKMWFFIFYYEFTDIINIRVCTNRNPVHSISINNN